MAVKAELFENMGIGMQCIDRMTEILMAAIAKHAITRLQAKLPLSPKPIKLHAKMMTLM